jgi:hypothetical protein
MRWALLLLVACRREPQQSDRPAIAPIAIDAAVDADEDDPPVDPDDLSECERGTAWPLTSRGVTGTLELVTCDLGEDSDNDTAREQGFIFHNMQAWLVWTPKGGDEERTDWGTWTNGWEWSQSHTLAGVLVAPSGEGVILEHATSYSAGPGIAQDSARLIAWRSTPAEWEDIATYRAEKMTVTVTADRKTARVDSCVLAEGRMKPDSCGGYEDGATMAPYQLSYTGTKVVRRRVRD